MGCCDPSRGRGVKFGRHGRFVASIRPRAGDADLDLVAGQAALGGPAFVSYYENEGNATDPEFVLKTGAESPVDGVFTAYTVSPSLDDLDGDLDFDLVPWRLRDRRRVASRRQRGCFVWLLHGRSCFCSMDDPASSDLLHGRSGFVWFAPWTVHVDASPWLIPAQVLGDWYGGITYGGRVEHRSGSHRGRGYNVDRRRRGRGVGRDSNHRYYENIGDSDAADFNLTEGTTSPFHGVDGGTACVPGFGRIDEDMDLDMILGQSSGVIFYYQNQDPTVPTWVSAGV